MAENYVEILVRSRDEAAPELDRLKAKLDELSHEVATARAEVDDKDAAARLDRMQAKLLDLDRKTANPKIRMVGALRAEAEIHMLEASLDKLQRKADEAGARGLLGRILFGGASKDSNGLLGGLGNSFTSAPGGMGLGELLSNPYGLAAIAGGVAALLPELAGLVSGFAAAGAGAASFYLLAKPTISNLEQDYKALESAQAAYTLAQNKAALDPTKANLKAEEAALLKLRAVRRGMTADEGGAAEGIAKLSAEYHKLTAAFAPEVFKVFNAGLKLADELLPHVMPFAKTFADVLTQLLGQASKFAGSKGFADWLKQFHSLEGPALAAIGHGIGQVVVQIGKLLTTMSAKDVVNAFNIAFNILSGTIDGLRHVLEAIMRSYDNVSRTMQRDSHDIATSFDALRHDVASMGHAIANTFDTVRHGLADSAHYWASEFDRMRHDIAAWTDDVGRFVARVVTFFAQLPGKIIHALGNVGSLLINAGRAIIDGLIRGIESGIGSLIGTVGKIAGIIASHKGPIEADLQLLVPHGQAIMQGLMNGIASRLPNLRAQLGQVSGIIAGGVNLSSIPGWGQIPGAGGHAIQLQVTGGGGSGLDQLFMTWLKNNVRASGGDPRIFNKKAAFL